MATKPSVRIPMWGTDHAPAVSGSGNSPQGTNPKITPDAGLIQSGFVGPPASPDYEIMNELIGNSGEYHDFFAALFGANGEYTGDATHGEFKPTTDTTALVRFVLENVNGGANIAEIASDRLALLVDNRLEAVAAGRMKHKSAATERRFEADGFGPILEEPAASTYSKMSEGLYLHNTPKGKGLLTISGTSGAYSVDVLNLGSGDLSYNIASSSIASTGIITLNFTDTLDLGTFRQLWIQVFSNTPDLVFMAEQLNPLSSNNTLYFRLRYQATAGGAWTVFKDTTAVANLANMLMNILVI